MPWKITNIIDVDYCELDTADGPYNKTGYALELRDDGYAITIGLMEHLAGLSAWEAVWWLNNKQAKWRQSYGKTGRQRTKAATKENSKKDIR